MVRDGLPWRAGTSGSHGAWRVGRHRHRGRHSRTRHRDGGRGGRWPRNHRAKVLHLRPHLIERQFDCPRTCPDQVPARRQRHRARVRQRRAQTAPETVAGGGRSDRATDRVRHSRWRGVGVQQVRAPQRGGADPRSVTGEPVERRAFADPPDQADSRARPLARRALMIERPARVLIRARNPCLRARRRLFGWNVRFTPTSIGVRDADMPGRRLRLVVRWCDPSARWACVASVGRVVASTRPDSPRLRPPRRRCQPGSLRNPPGADAQTGAPEGCTTTGAPFPRPGRPCYRRPLARPRCPHCVDKRVDGRQGRIRRCR